jgi:hypothetical protein
VKNATKKPLNQNRMEIEKIRYKHIYKRTVKHEYGLYDYYVVHVGKEHKNAYLGCSRKLEKCEKILSEYRSSKQDTSY